MDFRNGGTEYGLHRVVEPQGALPQAAERLDATGPAYDNEVIIDVDRLNIDSASFQQLVEAARAAGADDIESAVARKIEAIVEERGKMQNPVTGSGGMLLGSVRATGPRFTNRTELPEGARVATLVSLTLTPLDLTRVHDVNLEADQVDVDARAYLWSNTPIVPIPNDIDETRALSAFDVCGAPAQTKRLVEDVGSVLILGTGKSGALCAAAARDTMGDQGEVFAFDLDDDTPSQLAEANVIDDFRCGDATKAVDVLNAVREMTGGEEVDVVINTTNVADTEMSAILPCRNRGTVYFFNMATTFAKAALGAEGVAKDINLLIGNGYAHNHAHYTLQLLKKRWFAESWLS